MTAQRRSQNIQEVPESVQAISSRQLIAAGIKSTQDLGQITPNVTIISPIGAGNQPLITIRGIGLNDFDTNNAGPNGVYLDDVYLSAPGVQNFSMFDIAQVQVLKGPQGTLYGRNTSGGALLFTSNRPTDYFTADVHGEYGDYNTLQLEGGDRRPDRAGPHRAHRRGVEPLRRLHAQLPDGPALRQRPERSGAAAAAVRAQ